MKKRLTLIFVLALAAMLLGAYVLFGTAVINALTERAAGQALDAGDLARAAGLYARILERTPRDEPLRLFVCDLYREAGNFSRAEYTLQSVLSESYSTAALYKKLSALFAEQDKLYDAVDLLNNIANSAIRASVDAARPAPPEFSHLSGVYEERIDVSLTAGEGCAIYVSLAGDFPSVRDGHYTEHLPIGPGATSLIAAAVSAEGLVSDWATAEYQLNNINDPVTFADTAVETAIRHAIGKPSGQIFTSELWGVETLVFDQTAADYQTLDDLRYCTALRTIRLLGLHGSCDISAVFSLEELRVVSFDSMGVDSFNLKGIDALKKLTELYLPNNRIGAVTPLTGMISLTALDLSSNSVLDLSPLSGLTALRTLRLSQNAVSGVSPLSQLTAITSLDLDRNRIRSLSGLENMDRLQSLDVSYNHDLSSLDEIAGLTALSGLYASNCGIRSVPALSPSLADIDLSSNGIKDIGGLSGLRSLRTLDVSKNGIERLPSPIGFSALQTINVEDNELTSLTPLKGCPSLRKIHAFGNTITDPINTWSGTGVEVDWYRN
jgi:hypothetical protein